MEAEHKNAENESADLFSILYQLEQFRNCDGVFHFKLCYPDLVGNFTFPCNEWTQSSNPLYESLIEDFTPIKITFNSSDAEFPGLAWSRRGLESCLLEDYPYNSYPNSLSKMGRRSFCIGSLKGVEGKFAGPPKFMVEKVELFVRPGRIFEYTDIKNIPFFTRHKNSNN